MTFDPYQNWFGISAAEQPPDAYRLLGLARFETNESTIAAAITSRRELLRGQSGGPEPEHAARLLREVEKAAATLNDANAKIRYDTMLRLTYPAAVSSRPAPASAVVPVAPQQELPTTMTPRSLAPGAAAVPLAAVPLAATQVAQPVLPAAELSPSHKPRRVTNPRRQAPILVACGVAALLLGLVGTALLANWFGSRDDEATLAQRKANQPEQSTKKTAANSPEVVSRVPDETNPLPGGESDVVDGGPEAKGSASDVAPIGASPPLIKTKVETNPPAKTAPEVVPSTARQETPTVLSSPASGSPVTDPFADWPAALKLPSLLVKQPQPLVSFRADEEIELELNDEHADLEGKSMALKPVEGESDRWRVVVTGEEESNAEPVEVAQLAYREEAFQFVWSEGAPIDLAQQLKNCILHVAAGPHFHASQLRESVNHTAIPISLAKKMDIRPLPVSDLPALDDIELHVDLLETFPVAGNWKDGVMKAKLGKYVSIVLNEYPGSEIRFKVDRKGGDQLALFVSPVYRPNARIDMDFSMDRLDKMEQSTRRSLLSAQRDLVRTNAKLSALKSRKRSADGLPSSNPLQRQIKATAQYEANRDLAGANRKIATLKVKIPDMEARLKSVPAARAAVAKIHLNAHVNLRVMSVGETDELTLYSARANPTNTN